MELIEVKRAKEFASTFFADPVLKIAANSFLDHVPAADISTVTNAERQSIFRQGQKDMQKRIEALLTEAASSTFGMTSSVLRIAVGKINEMEVVGSEDP